MVARMPDDVPRDMRHLSKQFPGLRTFIPSNPREGRRCSLYAASERPRPCCDQRRFIPRTNEPGVREVHPAGRLRPGIGPGPDIARRGWRAGRGQWPGWGGREPRGARAGLVRGGPDGANDAGNRTRSDAGPDSPGPDSPGPDSTVRMARCRKRRAESKGPVKKVPQSTGPQSTGPARVPRRAPESYGKLVRHGAPAGPSMQSLVGCVVLRDDLGRNPATLANLVAALFGPRPDF